MGNLHKGHVALVDLAREHGERVVVTIFGRPTPVDLKYWEVDSV